MHFDIWIRNEFYWDWFWEYFISYLRCLYDDAVVELSFGFRLVELIQTHTNTHTFTQRETHIQNTLTHRHTLKHTHKQKQLLTNGAVHSFL